MNLNRISPNELDLLLQKKSDFLLIDLRENYELEIEKDFGNTNLKGYKN